MQQSIHWLVQERCNSSALAMELHLSCTKPPKYYWQQLKKICQQNLPNLTCLKIFHHAIQWGPMMSMAFFYDDLIGNTESEYGLSCQIWLKKSSCLQSNLADMESEESPLSMPAKFVICHMSKTILWHSMTPLKLWNQTLMLVWSEYIILQGAHLNHLLWRPQGLL